jgi:hypothetical protein
MNSIRDRQDLSGANHYKITVSSAIEDRFETTYYSATVDHFSGISQQSCRIWRSKQEAISGELHPAGSEKLLFTSLSFQKINPESPILAKSKV